MEAQFLSGGDLPPVSIPASMGAKAGDLLFTTGMAATGPDGNVTPGTFEEEFRLAMSNLEATLKAGGSSLAQVIKVTAYLSESDDFAAYNGLYKEYFKEPYPVRTTLCGCIHPSIKFEIEAVAVCD